MVLAVVAVLPLQASMGATVALGVREAVLPDIPETVYVVEAQGAVLENRCPKANPGGVWAEATFLWVLAHTPRQVQ